MIIYLSAIETAEDHSLAATVAKVPNVLTSFFYSGWRSLGQRRAIWERCLRTANGRLADSGAHTFRTAGLGGGAQAAKGVDLDAFFAAYVTWLKDKVRLGLIDNWVELDVGMVAGAKWVDEHRVKLLGAGLGRGLIQVWHSGEHDWDYWLWLLEESLLPGRSGYVAIEGHNLSLRPAHEYNKYLKEAYARGVKVHGFKITSHEDLRRWPFYSVDSTSWISPTRYGCDVKVVRAGGVSHTRGVGTDGDGARKVYRAPVTGERMAMSRRVGLLVESAKAWVTAERQLTDMWRARGIDWDRRIAEATA